MSGWDLDGGYRTERWRRRDAADRRNRNRDEGRCVNENKDRTHGKATHGVRCKQCADVHKNGVPR